MTIKDLPINNVIEFGKYGNRKLQWAKVSDDNLFFLLSECVYKHFDKREQMAPNHERRQFGFNYYPQSNIHQFLNSADAAGWFRPCNEYDECWDNDSPAFLCDFEQWEIESIIPREITVNVPKGCTREFGKQVQLTCRVALPSATEIGMNEELEEGKRIDALYNLRLARDADTMLRSPVRDKHTAWYTRGLGTHVRHANESWHVKPLIQLSGDLEIDADHEDLQNRIIYSVVPKEISQLSIDASSFWELLAL